MNKSVGIIILGSICSIGAFTGAIYTCTNLSEKNQIRYLLDVNKDGKISESEIKRFYDETETTPYTQESLYNSPEKDLERFLRKYKEE